MDCWEACDTDRAEHYSQSTTVDFTQQADADIHNKLLFTVAPDGYQTS